MLVDDSNIFSDPAFRGRDLQPEPSDAEPAAAPASEKFQWVNRATLRMLEELKIPYDEIHFGQPYAHVYVDSSVACSALETEKANT